MEQKYVDAVRDGLLSFKDLVKVGLIEFLDVSELNDSLIALDEQEIEAGTTHMEIAPFSILGVVAGTIPYPHHNQSPRNTYQCAMGKQAIGAIALNQTNRIDTVLQASWNPQRPLVQSKIYGRRKYSCLIRKSMEHWIECIPKQKGSCLGSIYVQRFQPQVHYFPLDAAESGKSL